MKFTPMLTADLRSLSEASDDPSIDLADRLRRLAEQTSRAVGSYLGVTVTVVNDGVPGTFSVLAGDRSPDEDAVSASLSLPLDVIGTGERGSAIVFYAATAGAFVDLAADLAHGLGVSPDAFTLDAQLRLPPEHSNLDDLSRIDQAIGMLLERGHTPAEARLELQRLAEWSRSDTAAVARKMLPGPA